MCDDYNCNMCDMDFDMVHEFHKHLMSPGHIKKATRQFVAACDVFYSDVQYSPIVYGDKHYYIRKCDDMRSELPAWIPKRGPDAQAMLAKYFRALAQEKMEFEGLEIKLLGESSRVRWDA